MDAWRKNLSVLWATQFLAMVGMNLVVPFLPFFVRQLGVTDADALAQWSGVVFAGPFITSLFATPFWGSLGDRYGRKPMVVRAIFGLALSQVLVGFSASPVQLLIFRMIQGAVSGFIAASLALVSTNTPRERIGYALGLLQSASAGGMLLGPFLGGLLADFIPYRAIFFITAGMCALGGFAVMRYVVELTPPGAESRSYTVRDNFRLMLADRRLRIIAATLVVSQLSMLMIEPIFALYIEGFQRERHLVSTLAGGIFSITGLFMVLSSPWWGRTNDRRGHAASLSLTLALSGLVYLGHIFVTDLIQLSVVRAVFGFASGGVLPALYSLTSVCSPPDRRGGMMATASSFTIVGNMLGPVLGGFVAGRFGFAVSFAVNSAILLGMSLIVRRSLVPLTIHGQMATLP
jgi:DHA1 family multidrug resistance protein-like MFS transporter